MRDQAPRTGWAKLCAGLAIAAIELVSDYLHPEISGILVIADVTIPVIMIAALLTIVARSKEQTCERIFRLLRWMVNRPEPPATQTVATHLHERVVISQGAIGPEFRSMSTDDASLDQQT